MIEKCGKMSTGYYKYKHLINEYLLYEGQSTSDLPIYEGMMIET